MKTPIGGKSLNFSDNRDKYIKDIVDIAWLGIECERGYMDFQKKYVIILKVFDDLNDERTSLIIEELWVRSRETKEDIIGMIRNFIKKHENIKVIDLERIEAKYSTFD